MIYYEGSDIIIRTMTYSDTTFIAMLELRQGEQTKLEKYLDRLEDQDKGKNIALVAECKDVNADSKGIIVGCVNVYPYSQHGLFGGECYSEIVDLKAFNENKYKNLEIKKTLLDVAEQIASEYAENVYTSVEIHNGEDLRILVQQGYVPDKSGFLYQNNANYKCSDCKNDDDLVLWLSKCLNLTNVRKFPLLNTSEYPFIKWYKEKKSIVSGRVNFGKYKQVNVNDKIMFFDTSNPDNFIIGKATFRHEYKTMEEMLEVEGVTKIFPFLKDDEIQQGVQFLKQFEGWERVEKYGCVAFGIEIESHDDQVDNL